MSTTVLERTATPAARTVPAPIPFTRVVGVELRKMFDTRSGFWLLVSIGVTALLATGAVVAFASDADLTYDSFGGAVGVPMTILLPIVAILSVTSEWSQRSGLTTFTLVPHRNRVIMAKLVCAVAVGVASMLLALAIGALGNVVGSTIAGVDTVWDISLSQVLGIVLANVLGLLVGFTLGVVIRSSAAAVVGYFVFAFVLPTLAMLLADSQKWFRDAQPWVDFNFAQSALYDGGMTGAQWAHIAVTAVGWVFVPMALGLWAVMRSEVK